MLVKPFPRLIAHCPHRASPPPPFSSFAPQSQRSIEGKLPLSAQCVHIPTYPPSHPLHAHACISFTNILSYIENMYFRCVHIECGTYPPIPHHTPLSRVHAICTTRSLGGPPGPNFYLVALRAGLTSSFAPFGCSGRVTHATVW